VGVQAVNASAFAGVSPDVKSESVHGHYPALLAACDGAIRIFKAGPEFFDIGSPRDYLDTARTIAGREGRPLDRGDGCVVAPTAQLDHTVLWDRVTVGAGARLSHCVVADDVVVPPGSAYEFSSLVMRGHEMIVTPL
jgi:NDP-sugar pyrophosphorylase family protein